jgi:hypothetical protein
MAGLRIGGVGKDEKWTAAKEGSKETNCCLLRAMKVQSITGRIVSLVFDWLFISGGVPGAALVRCGAALRLMPRYVPKYVGTNNHGQRSRFAICQKQAFRVRVLLS